MPVSSVAPTRFSSRRLLTALLGWFASAMLGLAAGAVWMAVSLYARALMPWLASAWLALPVGALLALAIRAWVWRRGALAGAMAAFATLVAAAYVSLLLAAIRLGGAVGMNLIDSLRSAGLGLLASIARMALTPAELVWFGVGAALAAWLASRKSGN